MKDIECPKCHTTFQVDDSTYESILVQVRSKAFREDLEKRIEEAELRFRSREETIRLTEQKNYEQRLSESNDELNKLRNEITRLTGIITGYDATKVSEIATIKTQMTLEMSEAIAEKNREISNLNSRIAAKDSELTIKVLEEKNTGRIALKEKEEEIIVLRSQLESEKLSAEKREVEIREAHSMQLQAKQDEIDRLKDFKLRLSTKMVGETLEQHCSILFSQAQSMGLYPYATFIKDNIAVEHSKGDFIFRDYIDGAEYVSIMFEMKNEMDATASKHRNDDFLDKLDKDRKLKGCEYAVLVSMLEQGNELYDGGIVDKSHRYPKMLVIRPQFFMPVLRLITEASKKGHEERKRLSLELEAARSQSRDFTKFEERINRFRTTFGNSVAAAHKKFLAATEGIDKTIEALEKQIKALRDIKANFEASEYKLMRANEMAEEDLTVKKLTHGAPSVRKKIEEAKDL